MTPDQLLEELLVLQAALVDEELNWVEPEQEKAWEVRIASPTLQRMLS